MVSSYADVVVEWRVQTHRFIERTAAVEVNVGEYVTWVLSEMPGNQTSSLEPFSPFSDTSADDVSDCHPWTD